MLIRKGAVMNDKLRFEVFGWIVGTAVMVAWLSMPLWLGS